MLDVALSLTTAQVLVAQRYMTAAAFVVLVYDICLTVDDEIRLVWSSALSPVKVLFLVNRYSHPVFLLLVQYTMAGFAQPLEGKFCTIWFLAINGFLLLTLYGVTGVLLLLRVYTIYGRSRRMLISLLGLYGVSFLAMVAIAAVNARTSQTYYVWTPVLKMCFDYEPHPSFLWAIWIPILIYDFVIFVLIVAKTWRHVRSPLPTLVLTLLLRDGALYFMALWAIYVFNFVDFMVLPQTAHLVGLFMSETVAAMMTSKVYLHLKDVTNHKEWSKTTEFRSISLSTASEDQPSRSPPVIPESLDEEQEMYTLN